MGYTIHQLAQLAGVSVRTLHHYDAIGLLKPSHLLANGYRQYEEPEWLRLQQILFFRELEFPLEDIKRILEAPSYSAIAALREQKKLLQAKQRRFKHFIQTIDQTIHMMSTQQPIQAEELYNVFKDDDVKQYQAEVQERWGNTQAYKQSQQRVSKLTKQQMEQLKSDAKQHTQALADAMPKGTHHPDVQALIAKSHQGVNFFYDCDLTMFRNLGTMYVEDPRFTAYYEKFAPGLALFMHQAIDYYCDQQK